MEIKVWVQVKMKDNTYREKTIDISKIGLTPEEFAHLEENDDDKLIEIIKTIPKVKYDWGYSVVRV